MIIAYRARARGRAVFLFGFAKNERENIGPDELAFLREFAGNWLAASTAKVHEETEAGNLQEIDDDEKA